MKFWHSAVAALIALMCVGLQPAAAQTQVSPCVFVPGTPPACNRVTAGNPLPVTVGAGGSTAVSTAALAANLVVRAAPGNLVSFDISADATLSAAAWWVMIYNATSAPADGAVTPVKCYAMPSGATTLAGAFTGAPAFSVGIVIGVSTTGCFSKTASVHAFLSGDFQ